MNIPIPDSGVPVQPGDDHFKYKGVYHPIVWINDLPYRPRVETLVVMNGNMVYVRLKDGDKLGSSGNGESYELPGGSIDADSSTIQQAENEVNEEALISIKNIYDTGITYYANYPSGFLMNGGDTPLEYTGHISSVFVAEYNGIHDRNSIEEKDLDPKISENGKFYPITKVVSYFRREHINALLNSPYVSSSVKGAIRILDRKNNPLKRKTNHYTSDDVVGDLFFVSKEASLEKIEGSNHRNGSLHINTKNTPVVRVFNSIDEALTGYDSVFGSLKNGDTIYAYTIDCKIGCVSTPSNEESPSSKITGELWIRGNKSPIKVKRLGLVRVISAGVKDKYYYGKNSTIVGEIEKLKHEWVTKDSNTTNVMESSIIIPNNKLYHGSTYLIEEFKPMSLDLGNAQQEPGWSTFAFADYTLALRFGLMRAIQKVKDYYGDRCKDVVCSWDVQNKKPFISAEHYKLMKPLITDFKYYVYTIDATDLDVGIGNDENFPEYTFRESGVVPESTDIIKIDGTLLEQNLIVLPVNTNTEEYSSTQERSINGKHNRGWYAVMMTKDYNNGLASAQLQKAVKDGKLKPGDDIVAYMGENGIAFDDDSISMKSYSSVTESLLISKGVYDVNFEDFESGKSNVVLITGLSGSGKSTLGQKIADKYKAELIELDLFEQCYMFENDEQLKEAGEVFYVYLSHHKDIWDKLKKKELHGKELSKEIEKFLKYAISWCKSDKKNKYVLEGVQIYSFLNKEKINGVPILFVGTSALKSLVRRLSRAREHSKEDFKNQLSELPQCIAWYIDENKTYEKFKKSVLESTEYSSVNKYPVFIALMHTGTSMSRTIRTVTHDEFTHATISFNSKLNPLYSFGTKNYPGNDHGFVQQEPTSDFYRHYKASYSVYVMYVSKNQRDKMLQRLQQFIDNADSFKFDIPALVACALKIPTEFRKKFFCSRFCMEIIGQGIDLEKVPSLWSPQQMSELNNISLVNKGDDFYKYDYRITEKNLKKIKAGETVDIVVESSSQNKIAPYYRVTYNGIGIYEAYKNKVGLTKWKKFKASPACLWLPAPMTYGFGYVSYFTKRGIDCFRSFTLMEMAKELPLNMITIEEVPSVNTKNIVYQDEFQVIVYEPYPLKETVLTRNSKITLFHGTDLNNLNTILNNSYNVGTKFSKPRTSSFWFDKYEYAAMFATMTVIESHRKEKFTMVVDNDMKVLVPEEHRSEVMDIIKKYKSYVYQKTIDRSVVGNGTSGVFPEYTIDIPIKPDKCSTVSYNQMLDSIKFEDDVYIDEVLSKYKSGKMTFQATPLQRLNHAAFYYSNTDELHSQIRKAKSYNKEISGITESTRSELPDDVFGLPEKRKYPLQDPSHVKSAIKFFNYVSKEDEKELAENILKKIDEYGVKGEISATKKNRIYPYLASAGLMESLSQRDKDTIDNFIMNLPTESRRRAIERLSTYNKENLLYEDWIYINGNIVGAAIAFRNPDNENEAHIVIMYMDEANQSLVRDLTDGVVIGVINLYSDIDTVTVLDLTDEQGSWSRTRDELSAITDITESWIPVMEAPNDEDTATDYTEETDPEEDDGTDTAQEETPEEEEAPTDYTEETDPETDDGEDEEANQNETGDTGEEDTATDYTDEAGGMDDTEGADAQDADTTTTQPQNGNLIDNNVLKNYSVLSNFEKLYNLTKEVSDSMDSVVMPTKLQNTVLAQVLKNLSSIKEFILSYVKFQFSSDNYAQNLYYYNIVLQALNLNLELLKRNRDLKEEK